MATLNEASRQIWRVVELVTDISQQTRLLAPKAAIDAAPAGKVAAALLSLPQRCRTLPREQQLPRLRLSCRLSPSVASTGWVVTAIARIGDTIRRVSELSHPVTHAVMKQRSANDEMNRSIHEAAVATRDGTQSISSVSNAVRETGDAAEQLLDAADEPSRMAVLLRSETDRILVVFCTV